LHGREPEAEGAQARHQAGGDADADQDAPGDEHLGVLRSGKDEASCRAEHEQHGVHPAWAKAIEPAAERELSEREREKVRCGEEPEGGGIEGELGNQ
jgi:hypothetical protein